MRSGVAVRDRFATGERRGLVGHDAVQGLKGTYRMRSTVPRITGRSLDATWGTIRPMQLADGVCTVGELELMEHLDRGAVLAARVRSRSAPSVLDRA